MTDKEIMYANPLEWKLMVAKNTGHTKVTYDELNELVETINRQQAEIEELKKVVIDDYASEYDSKIRAEAIKEFAERLKDLSCGSDLYDRDERWVQAVTVEEIDETYNEMVGEQE